MNTLEVERILYRGNVSLFPVNRDGGWRVEAENVRHHGHIDTLKSGRDAVASVVSV